jgi:DNA repair protein RadC
MMSEKQLNLIGPVRIRVQMVREDGPEVPLLIRTPAEASQYADGLRDSDRERFAVILLNTRNIALGIHVCTTGTLNQTIVDAGTVFKAALLSNAAAVILCHNHPSQDPTPSAEDLKITRTLIDAGKILGIGVLDHVILGGTGRFQSLREAGVVDFAA